MKDGINGANEALHSRIILMELNPFYKHTNTPTRTHNICIKIETI